jgi:osmoprotectant transport system permease protein
VSGHRAAALAAALATVVGLPTLAAARDTVTVGSKNFTEQLILGELLAQTIEFNSDLAVERKLNLAGTQFAFEALRSGEIDLYPEYTGTGLIVMLNEPVIADPEALFARVDAVYREKWGLTWRRPFGFNNTYALAVKASDPRFANVRTISQLAAISASLKVGVNHEYLERPDGFLSLVKFYGLAMPPDQILNVDQGLCYTALRDGSVDVIAAFATDGRIKAFDLRLLEDDRHFFPPYDAAPVVRQDTLLRYPQLGAALDRLAGAISDAEMIALSYAVDYDGQTAAEVVRGFLATKGLAPAAADASPLVSTHDGFWTYAWSRRAYVLGLLEQHLFLTITALLAALAFAVPLGIVLTRTPRLSGSVFGVINVFQTIPSLALLGFLIPLLGIGIKPAIFALFLYALLPLVRNTHAGIAQIDPSLKEACRGMGLTDFQILRKAELPLALPIIMAGVRTSAVLLVGTATISALVGAGGLGDPIFRGVSSVNPNLILLGAVPAALLAVLLDRGLHLVESSLVSKGLRTTKERA